MSAQSSFVCLLELAFFNFIAFFSVSNAARAFAFAFDRRRADVIVLACSILSFEKTVTSLVRAFPSPGTQRQLLQEGLSDQHFDSNDSNDSFEYPLIVDVLSVKEHPRRVLLSSLPERCDILCTHPMFGPESGKKGWNGLNFVYEKTRIGGTLDYGTPSETRISGRSNLSADTNFSADRVERFLSIFEEEGCRMVQISCEEHDTAAANSQFITHLVGRILGRQGLDYTPIDTKGFESVMNLIRSTNSDSFDLFYGLYKYNANSMDTILKMKRAMEDVEEGLKIMEREDVNAPGWCVQNSGDSGNLGGESNLLNFETLKRSGVKER